MFPLVYLVALLIAGHNVNADLPIHALIRDIAGKWQLYITQPVGGLEVACGSSLPNTVEGNLELGDYLVYIKKNYGLNETLQFDLTLDVAGYDDHGRKHARSFWHSLAVKDEDGRVVGRWTSIYDQGFEVVLHNGDRYFFYMNYTQRGADTYETDPTTTKIGWAYSTNGDNRSKATRRCAYGKKVDATPPATAALVKLFTNNVNEKYRRTDRFIRNGDITLASSTTSESVEKKRGTYPCSCEGMQQVTFTDTLPKEFRWHVKGPMKVVDQKRCGNCYAIASRYVLQTRFLIQLKRLKHKNPRQLMALEELSNYPLDNMDTTTCDLFNQGCSGGYPYLSGKHMREFGLITTKNTKDHCSLVTSETRYFAKDYGYVGGCYQCTACQGEDLIMREIHENGPVITAIDAAILKDEYDGSIITLKDGDTNSGICDIQNHPILTGWEYTSHAVAIEGWGEELVDGKVVKYWICRNSWGDYWGDGGYFKLVRGVNAFGIESEAVFIDPDVFRFSQKPNEAMQRHVHNHN